MNGLIYREAASKLKLGLLVICSDPKSIEPPDLKK